MMNAEKEGKTKLLPVSGLPDLKTREEVEQLIAASRKELNDCHETLKILAWCTDPAKIKPAETSVISWLDGTLDVLVGAQNKVGKLEVLIYKLETWLANWNGTFVVEGFKSGSQQMEAPTSPDSQGSVG